MNPFNLQQQQSPAPVARRSLWAEPFEQPQQVPVSNYQPPPPVPDFGPMSQYQLPDAQPSEWVRPMQPRQPQHPMLRPAFQRPLTR